MNLIEKAKLFHQIIKVKLFKKDLPESFQWMYSHIPAYKKFIDEQGLQPDAINCGDDIPILTKENYIEQYPLAERMNPKARPILYAQSGGTTGAPIVWPIGEKDVLPARYLFTRIEKFYSLKKGIECIAIDISEWAGGLTILTGTVLFRYNDARSHAIIKTDKNLSNLAKVLDREQADGMIIITYPEVAELQVKQLQQMPLESLKIIGFWFLGGSLTLATERRLRALLPNTQLRFNSGYLSSDAGNVGFDGLLSHKEGLKLFPESLKEKLAERYDPLGATVFVPAPEVHIEIIDDIFHLTNLYNPVPILRYRTDDIGGKVKDVDFHKPLYWLVGRAGDQLIVKGATMNLKRAKEYIVNSFNLNNPNEIVIRTNKGQLEPPTWTISFKHASKSNDIEIDIDIEHLKTAITDIIIEDSYEVRHRIESVQYSRATFAPEIKIL